MKIALERLNALSTEEAVNALLACCGSPVWARRVAAGRPFRHQDELMAAADRIWWELEPNDWLEAFSCHPKIGEKKAATAQRAEARRWSEEEQAGTHEASRETLKHLAEANRDYETKFGYIFIVCATGKSSSEMLALLRERLGNDGDAELRIAAEEQRRITRLRLQKLLEP